MKSKKWYVLFVGMFFLTTGCVREKVDMTIHKNKGMDFNVDMGISKTFIETYNTENVNGIETDEFNLDFLSDEEIEEMNKAGIDVTRYDDEKYAGIKAAVHFKNIDSISTTTDITADLASIIEDSEQDVYLFNVKKGLLKNKYTAKLNLSIADETIDSANSLLQDKDVTTKKNDSTDYSSMITSAMDMSFTVNLPYKSPKNNAMTVENDGKTLSWDLLQFKDTIEFTFELYNMTTIYILGGGFIITFIGIVLALILILKNQGRKNKNLSKEKNSINRGEKEQYPSITNITPTMPNSQQENNSNMRIQSVPVTTKPVLQPNPITPQPQSIQPTKVVGKSTESGFTMVEERQDGVRMQPMNNQRELNPSMINAQTMSQENQQSIQNTMYQQRANNQNVNTILENRSQVGMIQQPIPSTMNSQMNQNSNSMPIYQAQPINNSGASVIPTNSVQAGMMQQPNPSAMNGQINQNGSSTPTQQVQPMPMNIPTTNIQNNPTSMANSNMNVIPGNTQQTQIPTTEQVMNGQNAQVMQNTTQVNPMDIFGQGNNTGNQ